MGRVTLPKVRNGLEHSPGGPGRVGRPPWRFKTGQGTFLEV